MEADTSPFCTLVEVLCMLITNITETPSDLNELNTPFVTAGVSVSKE
jgi:hypothetical protein